MSFSSTTPLRTHVKIVVLLAFIQLACVTLTVRSLMRGLVENGGGGGGGGETPASSLSVVLFMFAEVIERRRDN